MPCSEIRSPRSEIVIVGGGVVGASVAYHLTARGAKDVLLLEREASQGLGSTGKATGGVRAQFETEINIQLSLYSLGVFENFEELTGVDCSYDQRGYLFFATNEKHLEIMRRNVAKQKTLGVAVEMLDAQNIAELVPGMNVADIVGGSFGARDGFINPLAVMRGFTQAALRNGAKLWTANHVLSIETAGGKVAAVVTDNGRIECETVVLCAGAWARELAQTAGVELLVEPLRRQIIWARSSQALPPNLPMVIDAGSGFHFRPAIDFTQIASAHAATPDTRHDLLFAYPDPEETTSFLTEFDEAFIPKVYARARERASFLASSEVVREKCRAGLYEMSPDHHAILGACEVAGLYLANGFSGHGVMHSPATGRALSEIILDGAATFLDVSSLHIERFKTGALIREAAFI